MKRVSVGRDHAQKVRGGDGASRPLRFMRVRSVRRDNFAFGSKDAFDAETKPLRNAGPVSGIGFVEVADLGFLNALRNRLHAGHDVADEPRARLNPQIVFESGQFSSILSMVSAGLGVSVVPAMAVEKRPGCCYVPLADERAERAIGAVTLKGKSLSRADEAFLAHLGVRSLRKRRYDMTPNLA